VFTGLETVWVTVDKVGIPTLGLDGTGPTRPPTLAPAPEGSGIMEETDMYLTGELWILITYKV
jgi:hypothetical protein